MPKDRAGREPGDKNYGKGGGRKKPRRQTHGATVSAVARATPGGKGKGKTVSAVAKKK